MIVDDISINRSILTEQLASWDIKSDCVNDGVEALNKLKAQNVSGKPYDLIILDFLMPGMNGQELAAIISKTPEIADTPIIMLSSCDQPVSSQQLKTIGIETYLVKPVRENRLYETILQTLPSKSAKPRTIDEASSPDRDVETLEQNKVEILVAEDFPLNQDVVRLMLADTPYMPVFANNGLEAVEIYKTEPDRFPIILMDVSMPVMDGHEATRLIQTYETENGLTSKPIIALTGHALKNDREECLKAGMKDYLSKPVKQSELLEKLELWIEDEAPKQSVA